MKSQRWIRTNPLSFYPTSATEQHGAHLPVGTDAIILSTLVDKMVNECEFEEGNLIFAPQLNVGEEQ